MGQYIFKGEDKVEKNRRKIKREDQERMSRERIKREDQERRSWRSKTVTWQKPTTEFSENVRDQQLGRSITAKHVDKPHDDDNFKVTIGKIRVQEA